MVVGTAFDVARERLSDGDDPGDRGDYRKDRERCREDAVRVFDVHRRLLRRTDDRTFGLGDDARDLLFELVERAATAGQLDREDVVEMPDLVSVPLVERGREQDEGRPLDEFDFGAGDARDGDVDLRAGRGSGILTFDELRHLVGRVRDQRDLVAHLDSGCIGVLGIDHHLAGLLRRGDGGRRG